MLPQNTKVYVNLNDLMTSIQCNTHLSNSFAEIVFQMSLITTLLGLLQATFAFGCLGQIAMPFIFPMYVYVLGDFMECRNGINKWAVIIPFLLLVAFVLIWAWLKNRKNIEENESTGNAGCEGTSKGITKGEGTVTAGATELEDETDLI